MTTEPQQGVFRRKDVKTVIHQNDESSGGGAKLRKSLRGIDLMGVGIGMVIGTGIFTLTGVQAKNNAGPAIVIAFLIAGIVALLAAICYAELAAAVPTAGSAYTYAYTSMGEIFAWVIAWDLMLEYALGASVVARGWSGYLGSLFNLPPSLFGEEAPVNVGAIIIVAILGTVAAIGVRESKWVTNGLVIIKVAICVFIVVVGAFFIQTANWSPFIPPAQPLPASQGLTAPLWQFVSGIAPTAFGIPGVFMAASVVFFAYSGFENIANMGEETRNPKRDMPKGLVGTLVICTILYLLVCLVVTGMVHYSNLDDGAPLSEAFNSVGLNWAAALISIAALAGLTSVILIDIMVMGRIVFAMARDGLMPAVLGRINPRTRTPLLMTVICTVGVALLSAFVPLAALADMVSIGTLFSFAMVAVAVAVLRKTKPDMKRPFKAPLSPYLPIFTAAVSVAMMASLSVETWLRFLVWLAVGMALYFFYGRRHSRLHTGEEATTANLES